MNVPRAMTAVVVALLLFGSSAPAASVSWIPGTTPPASWAISPANPGPSDTITFSGPTGVYSNTCVARSNLGGEPQVTVDPVAKVILLWFKGPAPVFCTKEYMPVAGLQGEFGPLAAGDWTFLSFSPDLDFSIPFTIKDTFAYHVDKDAPGPAHNGQTWATAFLTLQDALAVAGAGDEIWVAEGVYRPDQGTDVTPGDRQASFTLVEDLAVLGGFAGYGKPSPNARDPEVYKTILSGDLAGDDLWGILNLGDNSYHVVTGPLEEPPAVLDGFTVRAGNADGPFPDHYGAGLYNPGGKMDIIRCTFEGNTAVWGGGAMNLGGPIRMVSTQLIGNRARMLGGGLFNYEGDATMHDCRIVGNSADYADVVGGSAVYNLDGTLTILDSTIADNWAPDGRAVSSFSWGPIAGKEIRVANSILWNNSDEIWSNNLGAVEVTYSDVRGGWTGTGNISNNPQFIDPGVRSIEGEWIDGDYRLQGTSPAIDVGSNAALPADAFDLDEDGNTAEALPVDLDGQQRVQGTAVDMGAYEQGKTPGPGPGPGPGLGLTVCIGGNCIVLLPDPDAPASSYTYIGHTTLQIEMNFKGTLTATVTPTSPAGGTWTGWVVPSTVGPGTVTVELWVKGENVNIAALPGGATDVQVAEVKLFVVPAP